MKVPSTSLPQLTSRASLVSAEKITSDIVWTGLVFSRKCHWPGHVTVYIQHDCRRSHVTDVALSNLLSA
jgi:hypothetical protein